MLVWSTVEGDVVTAARSVPWPTEGLSFGGDYSPEQWPREVWDETSG